ncbi:hypothetical protein GP486_007249 [Trichoglossum hirsutum]|uniref:Uncharacterized protein n=1 Tax=Trichoglossum hirsutum TaxID=265104 RepID=A0A9P8L6Z1_9PEZI|nr:hypothetical protein GP486_007249 [Trichoglossum hirsutum]
MPPLAHQADDLAKNEQKLQRRSLMPLAYAVSYVRCCVVQMKIFVIHKSEEIFGGSCDGCVPDNLHACTSSLLIRCWSPTCAGLPGGLNRRGSPQEILKAERLRLLTAYTRSLVTYVARSPVTTTRRSSPRSPTQREGCCGSAPTPAIIPSPASHRPATIPLRTLVQTSHREDGSSSLLHSERDQHGGGSDSPRSPVGSEFSLWSDTGDIAEQLADDDDVDVDDERLRLKPSELSDEEVPGGSAKRVRYRRRDPSSEDKPARHGIDREDIPIPNPRPKRPSRADKVLAYIMSGGRGGGQMQGLTGRALLYELR